MRQTTEQNGHVVGFIARMMLAVTGLVLALFVFVSPAPAANTSKTSFEHLSTGFPLTGAHAQQPCETCHARGIFKGTPRECAICHAQGSRLSSTSKTPNHVQTTQPCQLCHSSTVTWTGARFRHTEVIPGNCATCHNGNTASGKPAKHPTTTASCDTCHRTTAWLPASFSHAGVVTGTCSTCHNGNTASGKSTNHITTTASCDTCHRTTTWVPASFSHTGVVPGSCATCHYCGGPTKSCKPSNHVVTAAACDTCHRTSGWIPATAFSHAAVVPGTCMTCHGVTSTGKPSSHIPAPMSCDACHGTSTFTTSTMRSHSATQGVTPGGCTTSTCHSGSYVSQNAQAKSGSHIPAPMSCDACHGTVDFLTSTMRNHTTSQGVLPGGCANCHNGGYTSQGARGKPSGHPNTGTNTSCDGSSCHTTRTWSK